MYDSAFFVTPVLDHWAVVIDMNWPGHHDDFVELVYPFKNKELAEQALADIKSRKYSSYLDLTKAIKLCCKLDGVSYELYMAKFAGNKKEAERIEGERIEKHILENWEPIN